MFKCKKKKTGVQTPEFRKSTPPPPPTSGSNVVRPNPTYVPLSSVKKSCPYQLPCGWCTKWDKKCDLKIGCTNPSREPRVNAVLYDVGIAPCVDCKKHKIDTQHCLICWAHNFNSFEAKEN